MSAMGESETESVTESVRGVWVKDCLRADGPLVTGEYVNMLSLRTVHFLIYDMQTQPRHALYMLWHMDGTEPRIEAVGCGDGVADAYRHVQRFIGVHTSVAELSDRDVQTPEEVGG